MSIQWLLEIISGEQKGLFAALVRFLLWCLTPFYRFAVRHRNRQFDSGSKKIESVAAKVISVGNITTGGTGKTPMVVWICKFLQRRQTNVAIVSRGYGSTDGSPNDEAMELAARLPNVPHEQNPDRVAAAKRCIDQHSAQTIVLDDGFQHRKLARDVDVVLVDASNPFGHGFLIPRGLLREPVTSLKRADVVVVTRCDRASAEELETLREQIANETAAPIAFSKTKASGMIQSDGTELSIEEATSGNWFAFSAIGNPAAFEASLSELGFNVTKTMRFRDHHHFRPEDLKRVAAAAKNSGADRIVCTHKDMVKIGSTEIDGAGVFALRVDIEVFEGRERLEKILESVSEVA